MIIQECSHVTTPVHRVLWSGKVFIEWFCWVSDLSACIVTTWGPSHHLIFSTLMYQGNCYTYVLFSLVLCETQRTKHINFKYSLFIILSFYITLWQLSKYVLSLAKMFIFSLQKYKILICKHSKILYKIWIDFYK